VLPGCYQPNDRHRPHPPASTRRADHGLPPSGFVFACFNNSYKILPEVFAGWMRLLAAAPDSVLWLFQDNPHAAANLRLTAAAAGIDPQRLVFAEPRPLAEHLERHHHIDLFLDTWPYNAHTTASDALWMGVPLVTCRGRTFAARVAASLLSAMDAPELIADTAADYEALALSLARNPPRLKRLRANLANLRLTSPLFDTPALTRNLETLFEAMHARRLAGLQPDHIG
jgi:protein O-GlcNAc transferase